MSLFVLLHVMAFVLSVDDSAMTSQVEPAVLVAFEHTRLWLKTFMGL